MSTRRKVLGESTDEPAGILFGTAEHVRHHGARRRLAMGAGDDDGAPAVKEVSSKRLRHRDVRQ